MRTNILKKGCFYYFNFNSLLVQSFWLDIDCGPGKPFPDQQAGGRALLEFAKATKLPSPTGVSSGNGLYAYWVLDTAISAVEWRTTAALLKKACQAYDFEADPSRTSDAASVLRPVGVHNRKAPETPKPVKVGIIRERISPEEFRLLIEKALLAKGEPLPAVKLDQVAADEFSIKTPADIANLKSALPAISPDGREEWICVGMGLHHEFAGSEEGLALWEEWSRGSTKFKDEECPEKWAGFGDRVDQPVTAGTIYHMAKAAGWLPAERVSEEAALKLLTDMRVSSYFAAKFKDRLRFNPSLDWLVFDGQRWNSNTPGGAYPFLKELIAEIRAKASQIENDAERMSMLKESVKLEAHNRQAMVISAAQKIPDFSVSSCQLDRDPMLLNVLNGTLDLRTGSLKQHSPADFITRLVPIEYNHTATAPVFEAFLSKIMAGNTALTAFIKRWAGYCLTGDTSEQVLLFLYGTGRNGKSTFVNILKKLLGDFAATGAGDLILHKGNGDLSTLSALAAMRGARLVNLNELNDGDRLNEAAVKNLTGGDLLACRFLHKEFFEYKPAFKLLLFGNHKPSIRGTDHGIWRRLHLLKFGVTISDAECDPHLEQKLEKELPGILAWAVQGCLEWQREKLSPPAEVKEAVAEYRNSEDALKGWLDDCCQLAPQFRTPAGLLLNSFIQYSNWKGLSARRFSSMLTVAGFTKGRSNGVVWEGLALTVPPFN
ncbi:phage/plasmid primase, P4 family [Trichlorobacter lovleyi]|uniref:phage/plasmid primase, P4 family n=1 Tax=Trichlorobacter lovleyi TaxID=313985 RepID=UPI0000E92998|nr:phage/plasmid primase, P4 family [Trichlorobacter lovleyi]